MATPVEKLREQLLRHELATEETLDGVTADTIVDFSRTLVSRGVLTQYQADQVLSGEVGSLLLDRYVMLDQIGAGGMGQVFLARHRTMQREVAIKLLPPKLTNDPHAIARFQREVHAAARLTHPNIVRAHDASEADGVHYLVMEFVPGEDLSSIVKNGGPMSVDETIECVIQSARGLQFAHEQGVMHRDIKPANLLRSEDGTVKILDMGLARFEEQGDASLTRTGVIMGTIDYMSPEQAFDTRNADARADVYSLGCTLHYLMTGDSVYDGDTVMKRLLAHRESPIPSLQERCAEATEALDTVFQKMLAKDSHNRLQTMTDVIDLLEQCRSGVTESSQLIFPIAKPASVAVQNVVKVPAAPATDTADSTDTNRNLVFGIAGLLGCAALAVLALAFWPDSSGQSDSSSQMPANSERSTSTVPQAEAEPTETELPPIQLPAVEPKPPIPAALAGIELGKANQPLAGLAAAPGQIKDVRRWQLQRLDSAQKNEATAWSPDGKTIAIAQSRGCVRIYDVESETVTAVLAEGNVKICNLDWNASGELAVGCDKQISIWAVKKRGELVRQAIVQAHTGTMIDLQWSPDGKVLASHGHQDEGVKIWDRNLNLVNTIRPKPTNSYDEIAWAPDSQRLALSVRGGQVIVVSRAGDTLADIKQESTGYVAVDWHPTKDIIATATSTSIKYWSPSGSEIGVVELPEKVKLRALTIKWSRDGKHVAGTTESGDILVARDDGTLVHQLKLAAPRCSELAWSPDSTRIVATGETTGQTSIVSLIRDVDPIQVFPDSPAFSAQSWHPSGQGLSVASKNGTIHHFDLKNLRVRQTNAWDSYLEDVAWSNDGARFAAGSTNRNRVKIFDRRLVELEEAALPGPQYDIRWSPDSQRLACLVPGRGKVVFLDRDGQTADTWETDSEKNLKAFAWNHRSSELAVVSDKVRVYDRDGDVTAQFAGYTNTHIAWSLNGSELITAGNWIEATSWSMNGEPEVRFCNEYYTGRGSLSINPADGRLASMVFVHPGDKYVCRIWSPDGKLRQEIATEWLKYRKAAQWNSQGTRLAILSSESVEIWSGDPLTHEMTLLTDSQGEAFVVNQDGTGLRMGDPAKFDEAFCYALETGSGKQRSVKPSDMKPLAGSRQVITNVTNTIPGVRSNNGVIGSKQESPDANSWQLMSRDRGRKIHPFLDWGSNDQIVSSNTADLRLLNAVDLSLQEILPHPGSRVYQTAWSPNATSLALGCKDGSVYLYKIATKQFVRLQQLHHSSITQVKWSEDGSMFASTETSAQASICIWSADGELQSQIRGTPKISFLAWHPTKPLLASYAPTVPKENKSRNLTIWDLQGNRVTTIDRGSVAAMDWHPETEQLYLWGQSIDSSSCAVIYDQESNSFKPSGLPDVAALVTASLSPDGKTVAVGTRANTVQFLNMDASKGTTVTGNSPGDWVPRIAWSPDSTQVVFPAGPTTVRITDVKGSVIADSDVVLRETLAKWSYDGKLIASAGTDNSVRRWSEDGKSVKTLTGHTARVRSVAWSPTDRRLASISNDGTLRLWDESDEEPSVFEGFLPRDDSTGAVATYDVAWHPSGKLIAAAGVGSTMKIVNPQTGEIRSWRMLGPVQSLAWNSSGTQLAIGCEPKLLVVWNPDQSEPEFFSVPTEPRQIEWFNESAIILSGQVCWKIPLDRRKPVAQFNSAGRKACIRISPDKQWCAVAAQNIDFFRPRGDFVTWFPSTDCSSISIDWAPGGTRMVATYNDACLRVWDVATGESRWVGCPVTDRSAVTFAESGKLLFGNPADLDATHQVIEYVDRQRMQTSTPSKYFGNQDSTSR